MKTRVCMVPAVLAGLLISSAAAQEKVNPAPLTKEQMQQGWLALFDGQTTFGWEVKGGEAKVEDGVLRLSGGTTLTNTTRFDAFNLRFDVRGERADAVRVTFRDEPVTIGSLVSRATKRSDGWVTIEQKVASGGRKLSFEVPSGATIELRNVLLQPQNLKSIFNGKDLTGWKEVPGKPSKYSVTENGELNVKNGGGELQSEGKYKDFVLQLDIISNGKHLNSGIFFRALQGEFWQGYEAQVRNQWEGDNRSKPVDFGTGGLYNRQPTRRVVSTDGEWFTMTIVADGLHFATWVDGYQTTDYVDQQPPAESARKGSYDKPGVIGLQGHDPTTDLSFRNIKVGELPPLK